MGCCYRYLYYKSLNNINIATKATIKGPKVCKSCGEPCCVKRGDITCISAVIPKATPSIITMKPFISSIPAILKCIFIDIYRFFQKNSNNVLHYFSLCKYSNLNSKYGSISPGLKTLTVAVSTASNSFKILSLTTNLPTFLKLKLLT